MEVFHTIKIWKNNEYCFTEYTTVKPIASTPIIIDGIS